MSGISGLRGIIGLANLRMQTMTSSDALKLCLVITDLVRRAKNGVNKVVVFDEEGELPALRM